MNVGVLQKWELLLGTVKDYKILTAHGCKTFSSFRTACRRNIGVWLVCEAQYRRVTGSNREHVSDTAHNPLLVHPRVKNGNACGSYVFLLWHGSL